MATELKNLIKIQEELDREAFFTDHIYQQKSVGYLKGFKEGLSERRDMPKPEKRYYIHLVNRRIGELKV